MKCYKKKIILLHSIYFYIFNIYFEQIFISTTKFTTRPLMMLPLEINAKSCYSKSGLVTSSASDILLEIYIPVPQAPDLLQLKR